MRSRPRGTKRHDKFLSARRIVKRARARAHVFLSFDEGIFGAVHWIILDELETLTENKYQHMDASAQIISWRYRQYRPRSDRTQESRITQTTMSIALSKLISNMIMTQRIMLRGRKCLHAVLIVPRAPPKYSSSQKLALADSTASEVT